MSRSGSNGDANDKDGLAVTGKAPVMRALSDDRRHRLLRAPFQTSSHPQWKAGYKAICNGWGMGETDLGAYAEKARVKGDSAGAAGPGHARHPRGDGDRHRRLHRRRRRCSRWEKQGLTPKHGPIVVTGAAGGVGSVAIAVLSKLGYHIIASTGRVSETDHLKGLGATEVIDRAELSGPAKPLAKERWAGGIDSVGSTTLANVLSMTKYAGAVAAVAWPAAWICRPRWRRSIYAVCVVGHRFRDAVRSIRARPLESRLASDLDRGKLPNYS